MKYLTFNSKLIVKELAGLKFKKFSKKLIETKVEETILLNIFFSLFIFMIKMIILNFLCS